MVTLFFIIVLAVAILAYFVVRKISQAPAKITFGSEIFILCNNKQIMKSFSILHKSELGFNLSPELKAEDFPNFVMEVSSSNSTFFSNTEHPTVKGRTYYRGYCFLTKYGKVLIFSGWTPPDSINKPLVYSNKKVPLETVKEITSAFAKKVAYKIGSGYTERFFGNIA